MGAITYDMENTSSIPAGKLFKAFLLDSDNLIPKILPHAFKSVEILEGDGGAGTIKLITFGEGSQFKSVKHRVDSIDKENLTYSYSIIEGDALMDILESITYHIKIVPTADGGSICVMVASAYGAIIFNLPQVLHRHCKQTKPNESIHP